ncbi:hypothetical protein [Salipaludibacillus aurantiacus]|uniref:Uncharacterized protein n=1 Tax=Salipaludibacillus aurantiacus TaxID=1601833 RepID=A0A1H9VEZ5_9BACI|nr:hypothetical protein [Salipaludibacillus aurantiacus]SES20034.1 hypothetical protein SAMN05518684_110138 [Salipaludibacillus aurantiacus]
MKKKLMLTALSSVLTLGVLGACGDMENNDGLNDNGGVEDNGGMNDDGMGNDNGDM